MCAFYFNANAQDIIVSKDGTTIMSKVIEVSSSFVKYKKYSYLDGPTYSLEVSKILSINYENGEKEVFNTAKEKDILSELQTVELKSGTEIPIQIVSPVKAADVVIGQTIPFKVSRDISVDGKTIIPYGTPVKGIVYEAKKSSWWGTKGRLGIRIDNIALPNGGVIPLTNGNVYVTGTNRTTLSVLLFFFVTIPACAICGSKAQIPVGYETMTSVANDIKLNMDGKIIEGNNSIEREPIVAVKQKESGQIVVYEIDGSTVEGKQKLRGLSIQEAKNLVKNEVLKKYNCIDIVDANYDYNKIGNRIKYITIEGRLIFE